MRCSSAVAALLLLAGGHVAQADDVRSALYDWTGFYVGINAGSANGSYDPTTTFPQGANNYIFHPRDVDAVNAAGKQTIKPAGFIGGVQAGYNRQFGPLVAGVEAGLDYLNLNGAANSGAVHFPAGGSGFSNGGFRLNQFVVSSYVNTDWLLTLRPRLGIAAGNWLVYGTGGLALTKLHGEFLFTDGNAKGFVTGAAQESDINSLRTGYIVGGGVETAVTDHIRLRAEYDYVNFGTVYGQLTSTNLQCCFTPPATQPSTVSMDLKAHLVRVGLNYGFGNPNQTLASADPWSKPPAIFASAMPDPSNWEFDVGTRLWLSRGTVGAPNPLLGISPLPSRMNSRLTYENVDAWSGETFARIDHKTGFFVKGFLGGGGITRGTLVDEDFAGFGGAYSNTVSPLKGHIGYANIDLGYTFLRAPGAKVGAFVGYNYFTQHINGFGCTQVAGDTTCVGVDPNFQVFAEDERYDSLRLGLAAEFMLSEKWKFSAEAAYLPRVKLTAQDDHNMRELLLPESANKGDGAMLEAILGYGITPNWNIGVGGRYWAWNMHDGQVYFDFLGGAPTIPQYARYNSERYGVFVQSDYRWGDTTRASQAMASATGASADWTGIYVGGHLGGAIANNRWSDPFGPTISAGLVNVGDFGDTVHSTGPLGGAQAGVNWQSGHWVIGLQGDWSAADLRGENTCFSGIGGLNCQNIVKDIATVAGRFGYAWDRALVYAKGGGASGRIEYIVLGNTASNTLGYGTTAVSAYGWMAGGGLEYALTDNWSTMFDYEHIDLGTIGVNFPSVGLVNAQTIGIRQTVDLVKLGINYKFNAAGWHAAGT